MLNFDLALWLLNFGKKGCVMARKMLSLLLFFGSQIVCARTADYFDLPYGELLPATTGQVGLWWASSGWKISQEKSLPETKGKAIIIRAARNEAEAAQLVVRPASHVKNFTVRTGSLAGPGSAVIPAENIEILKVRYVNVTKPTDKSSMPGLWPDPLPPLAGPADLEANKNQPFWIRVKVPSTVPAGTYIGHIDLSAENFNATVTVNVEVYDFALPDRMNLHERLRFFAGKCISLSKSFRAGTEAAGPRKVLG